jgi:2'-5' RNA ligase
MRAFLAVDLDEKLEDEVSQVQKRIMGANAQLKFVEPENLHFTLKFLGEVSDSKVEDLKVMIEDKIVEYEPFKLYINKTGFFPHSGYIRVIWLGVENPEVYSQMQIDLDQEFVKLGFKKEKSYIPHLTIARVKGAKNKEALISLIKEMENVNIGDMMVDKLVLKKSELTPVGPIYYNLFEFKL